MNEDPRLGFDQAFFADASPRDLHTTLDRIAVRDFVKSVEIGAFQQERGVPQQIRFTVVLEVAPHRAVADDDVDKVLSYDTIVEAIEAELHAERINLLETLAERIATRCLADARALRAYVKIEKLDRIPGSLGVEIVRTQVDDAPAQRDKDRSDVDVVYVPNRILYGDDIADWLDAIVARPVPAILALDPLPDNELPEKLPALVRRRIGLLSVEQNAWILAARDPRFVVVASRTELDWAAKHDRTSVWAPSKIVLDASNRPGVDADAPADLAAWFVSEIAAAGLLVAGSDAPCPAGARRVLHPQDL